MSEATERFETLAKEILLRVELQADMCSYLSPNLLARVRNSHDTILHMICVQRRYLSDEDIIYRECAYLDRLIVSIEDDIQTMLALLKKKQVEDHIVVGYRNGFEQMLDNLALQD